MPKLHFGFFSSFSNHLPHFITKSRTFACARIELHAVTFNLLDVE